MLVLLISVERNNVYSVRNQCTLYNINQIVVVQIVVVQIVVVQIVVVQIVRHSSCCTGCCTMYNVQLVCKLYIVHHTSIMLNVLQDVMDNVKPKPKPY